MISRERLKGLFLWVQGAASVLKRSSPWEQFPKHTCLLFPTRTPHAGPITSGLGPG